MTRKCSFVFSAPVLLLALTTLPPVGAISQADAQTTGYASRNLLVAGAGRINPWGALADIVKTAVAPYGWNVQVCYSCAGSEQEVIDVETKVNAASLPYNPASNEANDVPASLTSFIMPPPPNGPVDFGIASTEFLWWGYNGTQTKASFPSMPPYRDLRLVATIVSPVYLFVAAK